MEPDDLLCSRNARPQKDGKDSLAVLLLAERAQNVPFDARKDQHLNEQA